jgi:hypothetical protein
MIKQFHNIDFEELAQKILEHMKKCEKGFFPYHFAISNALEHLDIPCSRQIIKDIKHMLSELGLDKEIIAEKNRINSERILKEIKRETDNGNYFE